jgi:hypothetical protein
MDSRGQERSDWFAKVERVDFRARQFAVLEAIKQIHVRSAAGTKGLHGERVDARMAQMVKEKAGEKRLAYASVGASDEYESRHQVA